MRISHTVSHVVQEGAQNTTVLTRGGIAVYDTVTENTAYWMQLADAVANQELNLGGISTVKTLYIEADQNITVRLALNTNYAIDIKSSFPFALVMSVGVTAIYVTNASGATANLKVVLGG